LILNQAILERIYNNSDGGVVIQNTRSITQ